MQRSREALCRHGGGSQGRRRPRRAVGGLQPIVREEHARGGAPGVLVHGLRAPRARAPDFI